MLFAGLNLAAGEKMQNLKIILKSSNGEATAKRARSPTLLRGTTLSSTTATSPIMKASCA